MTLLTTGLRDTETWNLKVGGPKTYRSKPLTPKALATLQAQMGHSHIRTTERYLHSRDGRNVEAIRTLQFVT